MSKNTVLSMQKQKRASEKITMVTSYDYSMARLVEEAGINAILVGDSLGMTMLGYADTLPVTMEDMIHHTAAVSRALTNTFLVSDMPFLSYQTSERDALANAGRLVKEGHAQAVKLEGGATVASQIKAIVDAGIPVQGHIGMTPQSVNAFGGFKVQGKDADAAKRIVEDAYQVQEAGAFSVVLECVPAPLASFITEQLDIITIGIGAGSGCDGQVLVYQDLLGITRGHAPKMVKQFGQLGDAIVGCYKAYAEEVRSGAFPAAENAFALDEAVMDEVRKSF